jgi:hypothetical protein
MSIAARSAARAMVRLKKQSVFIDIAEFDGVQPTVVTADVVELMNASVTESEESCCEIRARTSTVRSSGAPEASRMIRCKMQSLRLRRDRPLVIFKLKYWISSVRYDSQISVDCLVHPPNSPTFWYHAQSQCLDRLSSHDLSPDSSTSLYTRRILH